MDAIGAASVQSIPDAILFLDLPVGAPQQQPVVAPAPCAPMLDGPMPAGQTVPPTARVPCTRPRRRVWIMRGAAVMLPLAAVLVLEGAFRLAGWYAEDPGETGPVRYAAGTMFFPEWDAELESVKPNSVRRVFVLGGSTAWGFGVEQPFGELLQHRLQRDDAGHTWQVVNGAVPAYGSHRVFEVAKRACEFVPDLVVVSLGHNEFLEEIFFAANEDFARAAAARRFARQFRLVRFLTDLAGDDGATPELQSDFFGNTHFPLIRSQEQYRLRLEFLKANLRALIECCRRHHTRLIVVPAVSNLLWPPGDSVHGPGYRANAAAWNDLSQQARRHIAAERWREAVETLIALEQIDSDYAESYYLHGLALLALDDVAGAEQMLHRANACDRRGDRVNPDVFDAIVSVCRHESTPVLDLRPRFHGELGAEFARWRAGEKSRLFLDHCHPGPEGHEIISTALGDFISRSGWFKDSRESGTAR